ncbi:MAG: glutamate-5-semialdehyde dehydrogenase [Gammaproteobacteria bacterium]|nr:glutamate-5-semialdehyde dehydrogenase [Gammaproteobacteria bacterium]
MISNISALDLARQAKASSGILATASTAQRNSAIRAIAGIVREESISIAGANVEDLAQARHNGVSQPLLDRLRLGEKDIERMCNAAEAVASLPDPIGEVTGLTQQPSGIRVGRMRIPLGVIGMIYESRPNVTLEAGSLGIKSGNACVLRGGSEAIRSNCAIADCISRGLEESGLPSSVVQLVRTTDRAAVGEMLAANQYIDLIVPRGGKGLIERVMNDSSIPVLKHLDGVCHVYIDDTADGETAIDIAVNSKAEKYAVCNAAETILISARVATEILPRLVRQLEDLGIETRGCKRTQSIAPTVASATEEDWREEYLDAIVAIKVVDDLDEAIEHIDRFGSGHTDTIVANDIDRTNQFVNRVDSATVMVNTSTQFADGFEFGLGAEIGISTDKLHARGPVGLEGLTTQKFVVYSDGAIRHR